MKESKYKFFSNPIRWRILIFALVLAATFSLSVVLSVSIRKISRESCWELLKSATVGSEESVSGTLTNFTNALSNFINKQMGNTELKSQEMKEAVRKIRIGTISAPVRLYLSDGSVVTAEGIMENAFSMEDYYAIESESSFISVIHQDFMDPESEIMEIYVPITRNGKVYGMASCVINPIVFAKSITTMAFSGEAYVLAIDKRDGSVIAGDEMSEVINIRDYGQKADGSDAEYDAFVDAVMAGEEARTTFISGKNGKMKYISCIPSDIPYYAVAVAVDEDIAFSRDKKVERIIWNVLISELFIFSAFIIWVLIDSSKQLEKTKQKKADEMKQLYEQDSILYKKAVLNDAYSYYRVNLTKDKLLSPIIERVEGEVMGDSGYLDQSFGNNIGISYSEMIADFAEKYIDAEERKDYMENLSVRHLLEEYDRGNTMPQFVVKVYSPSVGWHHRKNICYMLKDDNNGEINAMMVAYDISEQIKHQKEEQELQLIISTISDDYESMALLNYALGKCIFYRLPEEFAVLDGFLESKGDNTAKISGFARSFIYEEDREKFRADFSEAVLCLNTVNNKKFIQNYRIVTNEGPQWFQLKVIQPALFSEDRCFLVASRNINEEVKAQMKYQIELETALKEAKNANLSKTQFLFNMSHDLRTPMNAVLGYADMAERYINNPEKVEDCITKLKSAGTQLTNIINNILEISRIESGQIHIQPVPFDMRNVARELKNVFAPIVLQRKQNFNVRIDVRDYIVFVDYANLYRIIFNVLSNAIKYTPDGGEITYSVTQLDNLPDGKIQCMWKISDNGRGMSPEYIDKIFERFSREKSTTESGIEGNGLGMALVKELVEKMSGKIRVESELGRGTVVSFTIPFERCSAEDMVKPEKKKIKSLKGMKVLLVEDLDLNREIACDMLEDQGMEVKEAVNGKEAVDIIASSKPGDYDFVLMDIQMPVMDGYEATIKIRNLENKELASIPIIAMTANAFAEDRQRAMEVGMNEHIPKPVKLEELLDKVSKSL